MLTFLMMIADEQSRPHIEQLYKKYHKKMLRLAMRAFTAAKRNNPALDAEDAVQSTFLCIVRYAHAVPFDKQKRELEAYVFSILQHEISKILSEQELPSEQDMEYPDTETMRDFAEKIQIQEQFTKVVAVIRDMDPKYSTVLLLCYAEGLSVEQVARLLGLPSGTVYTRLRRGKQKLIEILEKEES
ncbi:MAG: RNA polymerase sigma factor [Clostridia bacterium]|nr:RNA polymerase sigma factor [Clostridia bacterium]